MVYFFFFLFYRAINYFELGYCFITILRVHSFVLDYLWAICIDLLSGLWKGKLTHINEKLVLLVSVFSLRWCGFFNIITMFNPDLLKSKFLQKNILLMFVVTALGCSIPLTSQNISHEIILRGRTYCWCIYSVYYFMKGWSSLSLF